MSDYLTTTLHNNVTTTSMASTGSGATATPGRSIVLAFDQYEIVLAVTEDNRLLGIVEVREKKDFRNVKQKISSTGSIDLERFAAE